MKTSKNNLKRNRSRLASSLVVFHTNDFSDLIDKSTSQG